MAFLNTRHIGLEGEKEARIWLEHKGWRIVAFNFQRRGFEIDIIALDPQKKVLRFIEVKNAVNCKCTDSAHSVYCRNIKNYYKGAEIFLYFNPEFLNYEMSMDVMILNKGSVLYYNNVSAETVIDYP